MSSADRDAAFLHPPASGPYLLPSEPVLTIEGHADGGGFAGLQNAVATGTDATISLLEEAGVRGRGGAGFSTGKKWASVAELSTSSDDGIVVVNAAEGEPGTFKDRRLIVTNPFLVIEGALIAAATVGMNRVVIATKAKFTDQIAALEAAIAQVEAEGLTTDIAIEIVQGPEHYLFGEETAMLEVIEGEDPLPRHLPPYQYGLFTTSPQLGWSAGDDAERGSPVERSNPSLVNNAETLAHVALICRYGSEWYRSMGTVQTPGPTILTLTGDTAHAVVVEIESGVPLRGTIDEFGGGTRSGRPIKAVLSGVSNPVLTDPDLSTPISYEDLREAGGGLGSAGFIVFDDTHNMVDVAYAVVRFLHVESCGQCNPCKTGTGDIAAALEHLVYGTGDPTEIEAVIARRLQTVTDASRCYLPTQARDLITSLLQQFPADLNERLAGHPGNPNIVLGPLESIVGGVATYSPTNGFKRPDWTSSETPVRFSR